MAKNRGKSAEALIVWTDKSLSVGLDLHEMLGTSKNIAECGNAICFATLREFYRQAVEQAIDDMVEPHASMIRLTLSFHHQPEADARYEQARVHCSRMRKMMIVMESEAHRRMERL